jgi:cytochrome c oxidase subunit 3
MMEQQLSRKELQDLRNRRTGLAIFQATWIIVFIVLILAQFDIRARSETWPPPGVDKPSLILPTIATVVLIVSSVLVRRASNAVKVGDHESFVSQWRIVIGLGVLFVAIMATQWISAPFGAPGQYGVIFRVLIGYHGFHALVIGAFMVSVYRKAEQYGPTNFWPVEAAGKLWNWVTVIWILFYLVLYWL